MAYCCTLARREQCGGEDKAKRELQALNREEVDTTMSESFLDELSANFHVTIKPAEQLEPATDYFLLLRNGLPVLPTGAAYTGLQQYRSAGTVCEDRLIRFRTETKSHRKTVSKTLQHTKHEQDSSVEYQRLQKIAAKDLGKVDWRALKTRVSNGLSSEVNSRVYLNKARAANLAYKEELRERYMDGALPTRSERASYAAPRERRGEGKETKRASVKVVDSLCKWIQ